MDSLRQITLRTFGVRNLCDERLIIFLISGLERMPAPRGRRGSARRRMRWLASRLIRDDGGSVSSARSVSQSSGCGEERHVLHGSQALFTSLGRRGARVASGSTAVGRLVVPRPLRYAFPQRVGSMHETQTRFRGELYGLP